MKYTTFQPVQHPFIVLVETQLKTNFNQEYTTFQPVQHRFVVLVETLVENHFSTHEIPHISTGSTPVNRFG